MTKNLWRDSVHNLTPYVPGKPIEDVQQELGIDTVIRLASNENPYGPSPKALASMADAAQESWLYPEPTSRSLRMQLAEEYGLSAEQFMVGNGADHIITLIGNAYINSGDEIIYCNPTFSSYKAITQLMDGVPVEVESEEDFVTNLDGILNAVTEKTKLIFICNPNNPTGTILENEKMEAFFENLPKDIIVIFDEAYVEYITQENYKTGIDFIKAGHPIISIRTFSKYYGLAGARIGYAIANKDYIDPLQAVRQTFSVSRFALAGAASSLEDTAFGKSVYEKNKEEKEWLTDKLKSFGCDVVTSHSNFIFADMKQDTTKLFNELMQKGILIRPCAPWKLPTFARITIGTAAQNSALIKALEGIL